MENKIKKTKQKEAQKEMKNKKKTHLTKAIVCQTFWREANK